MAFLRAAGFRNPPAQPAEHYQMRPDKKQDGDHNQPFGTHSTVTDFARLRGWSTSVPLATAT